MPIHLPPRLQLELRNSANVAIWQGAHDGYLDNLPINEVHCIRNLISRGVPLLYAEWKIILARIGICAQVSGIICHGHPWVRFRAHQTSCELGDFLLVHDHQPSRGGLERRAAIVQAKVYYDNGGVRHASRNALQLELYRDWPRFTYTRWPGGMTRLNDLLNGHELLGARPTHWSANCL